MKEFEKITVVTQADTICPYCGKYVNPKGINVDYIVSGSGKFKRKQYFHHECLVERINNAKRNVDKK